jgi:hypothetical protein
MLKQLDHAIQGLSITLAKIMGISHSKLGIDEQLE